MADAQASRRAGRAVCADAAHRPARGDLLGGSAASGHHCVRAPQTPLCRASARSHSIRQRLGCSAAAALRTWLHGFPGAVPDAIVDQLEVQLDVKAESFDGVLSWDAVREVSAGVDILPHGRRHLRLEGMADAELDAEVAGPLADIRAQLGSCPPVFSYPYGRFDARVLEAAQRAGYRAALSTRAGFAKLRPSEHLRLRRVHIYHGTLAHFRLDLTPAFAWYTARREDLSASRQRRRA